MNQSDNESLSGMPELTQGILDHSLGISVPPSRGRFVLPIFMIEDGDEV